MFAFLRKYLPKCRTLFELKVTLLSNKGTHLKDVQYYLRMFKNKILKRKIEKTIFQDQKSKRKQNYIDVDNSIESC